jgi:hypothetical protein
VYINNCHECIQAVSKGGTVLQAGVSRVRFPIRPLHFFQYT